MFYPLLSKDIIKMLFKCFHWHLEDFPLEILFSDTLSEENIIQDSPEKLENGIPDSFPKC